MDKSLFPGVILISRPRGQGLCLTHFVKKKLKKEYIVCLRVCGILFFSQCLLECLLHAIHSAKDARSSDGSTGFMH